MKTTHVTRAFILLAVVAGVVFILFMRFRKKEPMERGLELSVVAKESFAGGDVQVELTIHNRGKTPLKIYRPYFGHRYFNVDIRLIELANASRGYVTDLYEADSVRLKERASRLFPDSDIVVSPTESVRFSFNLRRYFYFSGREGGEIYQVQVILQTEGGALMGSANFYCQPSPKTEVTKEVSSPPFRAWQQIFERGYLNMPPWVSHRAYLGEVGMGSKGLFYETTMFGFPGAVRVADGEGVKNFFVVYCDRPTGGEGDRIFYDRSDFSIVVNPSNDYRNPNEKGDISTVEYVAHCDYIGLVFQRTDKIYFWATGRYAPLPYEERIDLDQGFLDVLCPTKVVVESASKLLDVTTKEGIVVIHYLDSKDKENSIKLDERGNKRE